MARDSSKVYETSQEVFPKRLRTLMEETETNQVKLADAIGITRQAISLYAQGQTSPDWKKLKAIAEYFNVSCDWLLGLSDVKSAETDMKAVCEFTGLSEKAISGINQFDQLGKYALDGVLSSDLLPDLITGFVFTRVSANGIYDEIGQTFNQAKYLSPDGLNSRATKIDHLLKNYRCNIYDLYETCKKLAESLNDIDIQEQFANYASKKIEELVSMAENKMNGSNAEE